jgi:hypothetical protein
MPNERKGIDDDDTSASAAHQEKGPKVAGNTHSACRSLFSHQPAVLFSQNKPATSNQPTVLFSQNKSAPAISHQPN